MKSKIIAAVAAAAALTAAIAIIPVMAENESAAEPAAAITIESKAVDVSKDTVSVNVSISGNPGIVTMTIPVTWDTDVLELTGITNMSTVLAEEADEDDVLTGWLGHNDYTYAQQNGVYYLAWDNDLAGKNFTADGVLCTMNFKIKDAENFESAEIEIEMEESDKILPISNIMNFDMNDLQEQFTYNDGTLTAGGAVAETVTVKGTVTSFSDGKATIALYRIKDDGEPDRENGPAYPTVEVTGKSGSYEIHNVVPGEYILEISKPNHVTRTYRILVNEQ